MKMSLAMRTAGVAAVAALGLAACGSNNSTGGSGSSGGGGSTVSLNPQGSTFQQTLEEQWASKFAGMDAGVQVTYTGSGSSTGIQQFGLGKADFAGSDVTMTPEQQTAANKACGSTAISLPITSGGVAIMYNVKGVSNLKLTAATLGKIMSSQITTWNNSEIAGENPGVTLPNEPIHIFYRSDGSGTTSVLAGFLSTLDSKTDWPLTLDTVDKTVNWKGGAQGAVGSDGVAAGVQKTEGGITYAEISYARQDKLNTAAIEGAKGGFQSISAASVAKSIQSGFTTNSSDANGDLAGTLSFKKMTGYPISTVSYVLVCTKYSNSSVGSAVKAYLTYAAGSGQGEANALGFAPLPSDLQSKVQASVNTIS